MNKSCKSILLLIVSTFVLCGCEMVMLNPKGLIGVKEKELIITATLLMLIVVIPVIVMTLVFAWRYRESNTKAKYDPTFYHSNKVEFVMWTIPIIIISILAVITWKSTHDLDPYKPIEMPDGAKTMTIQVVALDWKWLFIYPEEKIATVNFVQFPVDVAVDFKVTSDPIMNSFMIPQLGGQVYAMAGMQTHLFLIANHLGDYHGRSFSYSGDGFSGMTFNARVSTQEDFERWVTEVRTSSKALTAEEYNELMMPSKYQPVSYYSTVDDGLFGDIIAKYMMNHGGKPGENKMQMKMNPRLKLSRDSKAGDMGMSGH